MGLNVIGEEEEEGAAEEKDDKWFEGLLSELGDGDEEQPTHIEYILP
jgi:hypothetical protein